MRRKRKRLFVYVTVVIGILLLVGSVYQRICVMMDRNTFKHAGQLVEINGRMMHLYTEGTGEITVVFASGWGTVQPYVDFFPLYSHLSSHAKIAVYDRFGTGFSDLTERKRDIDSITEEVHALLEKSGQKPPYIFVGHSLGSLEAIRFAQTYPDQVKGIVLLDGGTPEYYEETLPLPALSYLQRFFINTGVFRALSHSSSFMDSLNNERNALLFVPKPLRELDRKAALMKANNRNITDEMRQSRNNAKKVLQGEKPLRIPLIALTAGSSGRAEKNWLDSQRGWTNWGTDATQIVVEDAYHYIHHYRPDVVAEEIKRLIKER